MIKITMTKIVSVVKKLCKLSASQPQLYSGGYKRKDNLSARCDKKLTELYQLLKVLIVGLLIDYWSVLSTGSN